MVSPLQSIKQRVMDGLKSVLDPSKSQDGKDELKKKKLLLVVPHPGDEAVYCGGTIKWAVNSGGAVDVLFMREVAPSQAGLLESDDVSHALKACGVLGVRRTLFMESPHSKRGIDEVALELTERVLAERYDFLFAPCPSDSNTQNMLVFRTLLDTVHRLKEKKPIWLFGTERLGLANRSIDITASFAAKVSALEIYEKADVLKNLNAQVPEGDSKSEKYLALEGAILVAVSELMRHHSGAPAVPELAPTELELVRHKG